MIMLNIFQILKKHVDKGTLLPALPIVTRWSLMPMLTMVIIFNMLTMVIMVVRWSLIVFMPILTILSRNSAATQRCLAGAAPIWWVDR